MPRKNKSNNKPRKPYRKSGMKGKTKAIPRTVVFPDSLYSANKFLVMRYTRSNPLTTGIVQNTYGDNDLYNLNTIYSPKSTGPVNRAQGFDQIAQIYHRFKVWGAKVTVTWTNPSQDGLVVAMRPAQAGNTDYISGEIFGISGMKRWTVSKPINNTGSQVVKYTRYFDIASLQGLTKAQFAADNGNLCGTYQANPTNMPFLELSVCNTADTTNATIAYKIEIDYNVQLFDRQVLPTSTI